MNLELASYLRLRRIDELTWRQHFFLEPEDEVYFLREYTPRESFTYNDTNQFIFNFKKSPEKKETHEWRHKQRAISLAGSQLQTALLYSTDLNQRLSQATLVPIPPSAIKNSPQYDDRGAVSQHSQRQAR